MTLAWEDHTRGGRRSGHRASDAPVGAPLTVIFVRQQDYGREDGESTAAACHRGCRLHEHGPATLRCEQDHDRACLRGGVKHQVKPMVILERARDEDRVLVSADHDFVQQL
jgi:hypothetical protein